MAGTIFGASCVAFALSASECPPTVLSSSAEAQHILTWNLMHCLLIACSSLIPKPWPVHGDEIALPSKLVTGQLGCAGYKDASGVAEIAAVALQGDRF